MTGRLLVSYAGEEGWATPNAREESGSQGTEAEMAEFAAAWVEKPLAMPVGQLSDSAAAMIQPSPGDEAWGCLGCWSGDPSAKSDPTCSVPRGERAIALDGSGYGTSPVALSYHPARDGKCAVGPGFLRPSALWWTDEEAASTTGLESFHSDFRDYGELASRCGTGNRGEKSRLGHCTKFGLVGAGLS